MLKKKKKKLFIRFTRIHRKSPTYKIPLFSHENMGIYSIIVTGCWCRDKADTDFHINRSTLINIDREHQTNT